jgi:hypothetical protein
MTRGPLATASSISAGTSPRGPAMEGGGAKICYKTGAYLI